MRIISDFKDYYDCIQKYDQDRETIFLRQEGGVKAVNPFKAYSVHLDGHCDVNIIGFCGKVYPSIRVAWQVYNKRTNSYDLFEEFAYNIDQMDQILKDPHLVKVSKQYYAAVKKHRRWWNSMYFHGIYNRKDLIEFFEYFHKEVNKQPQKLFQLLDVPIFVYPCTNSREISVTTNPNLSKYQFFKLFDVNMAYQELVKWHNNKAYPDRPIPKLDDVTLAESKGFDKYSFRKDKQK